MKGDEECRRKAARSTSLKGSYHPLVVRVEVNVGIANTGVSKEGTKTEVNHHHLCPTNIPTLRLPTLCELPSKLAIICNKADTKRSGGVHKNFKGKRLKSWMENVRARVRRMLRAPPKGVFQEPDERCNDGGESQEKPRYRNLNVKGMKFSGAQGQPKVSAMSKMRDLS
ncbi:hypothetical protein P692DRAFT_201810139 [Suillus brevipes Sb2]|nr:hypothetical protein P692DRAFT_201810139 [Suillus brevipes Sb2]